MLKTPDLPQGIVDVAAYMLNITQGYEPAWIVTVDEEADGRPRPDGITAARGRAPVAFLPEITSGLRNDIARADDEMLALCDWSLNDHLAYVDDVADQLLDTLEERLPGRHGVVRQYGQDGPYKELLTSVRVYVDGREVLSVNGVFDAQVWLRARAAWSRIAAAKPEAWPQPVLREPANDVSGLDVSGLGDLVGIEPDRPSSRLPAVASSNVALGF